MNRSDTRPPQLLSADDAITAVDLILEAAPAAWKWPVAAWEPWPREDGMTAFARTRHVFQLVDKLPPLQCISNDGGLLEAVDVQPPVELTVGIADAKDDKHAAALVNAFGLGLKHGQYGLVLGQGFCPLKQFVFHRLLPRAQVGLLNFVGRYLLGASLCPPTDDAVWLAGAVPVWPPRANAGSQQMARFRHPKVAGAAA